MLLIVNEMENNNMTLMYIYLTVEVVKPEM